MSYQSLAEVRIIDPLLTTVAHGFNQPEFVGSMAFPPVMVKTRSGRIIRFGDDAYYLQQLRRTPGASTLRVSGGWGSDSYSLFQDAVEEQLPIEHLEEAQAVGLPIDMQERAVKKAAARVALRLEFDQMSLLANPGNYLPSNRITLTGSGQLSDPNSDIDAVIETGCLAVLAGCGFPANVAILGLRAWSAAKRHPRLRTRLNFTDPSPVVPQTFLDQYGLSRGGISVARWLDPANPNAGRQAMAMDNSIALLYVPQMPPGEDYGTQPNPESDIAQPSFGYTYQLDGYPIAEEPYYDRNKKTWLFPHTAEHRPVLTGMRAGYLISNVAA